MNFLLKPLAGPIATGLAILCLALAVGQCTRAVKWKHRAEKAEKTVERVERDLRTCQGNVSTLDIARKAQNAALEAQKADGLRRATELARALQAAKKQASAAQSAADRILAFRSDTADQCAKLLEVDALVKESVR